MRNRERNRYTERQIWRKRKKQELGERKIKLGREEDKQGGDGIRDGYREIDEVKDRERGRHRMKIGREEEKKLGK